jgi:uncharacterized membrane protein
MSRTNPATVIINRPDPAHHEGERPDTFDRLRRAKDDLRRAFREFLAVPTIVITGFLVLAILLEAADRATPGWLDPLRQLLQRRLFVDAGTTSDVLSAIAAGIITVTSITVSVLLLAVQQSAASMSSAVFDQFLRRRKNQLSFGYFIGLGLYTLVMLATVHEKANAVLGASLGVVLTIIALYVLVVLLYSTVDQMRPSVVLGSIGELTLKARRGQRELVERTRRRPAGGFPVRERVTVGSSGYVTHIDLSALGRALEGRPAGTEVELRVSLGSFVAYGDAVAELRGPPEIDHEAHASGGGDDDRSGAPRESLADAVRRALHLEADRDIGGDPAYGIEQLHNVGWTSISSAKSNPAPGLFAVHTLRDLLARWSDQAAHPRRAEGEVPTHDHHGVRWALPVVYTDDVVERVFGALESLGVAASESMQHQALAEVLRAIASLAGRLPGAQRHRAAAIVERLLPTVQGHVRTQLLDDTLALTAESLAAAGEHRVAALVRAAAAGPKMSS